MQNTQEDDSEYIVVPLEIQVAMSTFLYVKWQENVTKRLDKYLTFPQWLQTIKRSPHQLEDYSEIEPEDKVTIQEFYFATIEWHLFRWQTGVASVKGDLYTSFEISLIFFSLIWVSNNESATRV